MGTGSFVTSEILGKGSKSPSHDVKRLRDSSTETKDHPLITHHVYMNPWAGSPRVEPVTGFKRETQNPPDRDRDKRRKVEIIN